MKKFENIFVSIHNNGSAWVDLGDGNHFETDRKSGEGFILWAKTLGLHESWFVRSNHDEEYHFAK